MVLHMTKELTQILLINTGGTFNKRYNPITGDLNVLQNNEVIEDILKHHYNLNYTIHGMIFKDSLDITQQDRIDLLDFIQKQENKKIIIIHGTDTIDQTATFLAKQNLDKTIILTAAMIPYSIEQIEATANLSLALGAIQFIDINNIFIAISGIIKDYTLVQKDKSIGVFKYKNK